MIYDAVNEHVLARVPPGTRNLLDVGCGTGALGARLKEQLGCIVEGITYSPDEDALARERLDRVWLWDLSTWGPVGLGEFECIVCSHVLEHLTEPRALLRSLAHHLAPGGTLLVALPNVLYWRQRFNFLRGQFRYEGGGLMDRTHYRFFDWNTARELLTQADYEILDAKACGAFPGSRLLGAGGRLLDLGALRAFPGLFGTQFVLSARPLGTRRA